MKTLIPVVMCVALLCCINTVHSEEDNRPIVNLGRLRTTQVSASSVNGSRSMSNQFYGVINLFDAGDNIINNINYTYWLTDSQPNHWVKIRFGKPVEVHKIVVEVPRVWELKANERIRDKQSPLEFAIELECREKGQERPVARTFDSIPMRGFLTTYTLTDPVASVTQVKVVFPGENVIKVSEIMVIGRALKDTDLTPALPVVDIDYDEAHRIGSTAVREYVNSKYSTGNVTRNDEGWVYAIRRENKEILRVIIDEKGSARIVDLESDIIRDIRK